MHPFRPTEQGFGVCFEELFRYLLRVYIQVGIKYSLDLSASPNVLKSTILLHVG